MSIEKIYQQGSDRMMIYIILDTYELNCVDRGKGETEGAVRMLLTGIFKG